MTLRSRGPAVPVARVLFPTPHPTVHSAQQLADEVARIRQVKRDTWNFDFETNQPLPGRYEWTPVAGAGDTAAGMPPPAVQRRPVLAAAAASGGASSSSR
jgi:hypothetical protein